MAQGRAAVWRQDEDEGKFGVTEKTPLWQRGRGLDLPLDVQVMLRRELRFRGQAAAEEGLKGEKKMSRKRRGRGEVILLVKLNQGIPTRSP